MNARNQLVIALLFGSATAQIATLYVDSSSTTPVSPYNSWSTAAANIQAAMDVAEAGDTVHGAESEGFYRVEVQLK